MSEMHDFYPAIVLVNTQMPENIGAVARAMMNFGMSDLRLVAPREEWPNKRAYDLASHAGAILDNARCFATTVQAVADCERVYAATARPREMVKAVLNPSQAADFIAKDAKPSAIVFGPERTGLSNDDVTMADTIITIPAAADNTSLNIAQSVVVVAYECFQKRLPPQGRGKLVHKSALATKQELQNFFDHLEHELDRVDFWKTEEKKTKMWLNLRNIFTRSDLTEQEVRTLHGVIAEIRKGNSGN